DVSSCTGRCGAGYSREHDCQCDFNCHHYMECCPDFRKVCTVAASCEGRCFEAFERGRECDCDADCERYGKCCPDYAKHCKEEQNKQNQTKENRTKITKPNFTNKLASFSSMNTLQKHPGRCPGSHHQDVNSEVKVQSPTPPAVPSCQGVVQSHKGPLSLLCSRLSPFPSSLSPSWCSRPFPSPVPFPGHAAAPQGLSGHEGRNWTQHSRSLSSASTGHSHCPGPVPTPGLAQPKGHWPLTLEVSQYFNPPTLFLFFVLDLEYLFSAVPISCYKKKKKKTKQKKPKQNPKTKQKPTKEPPQNPKNLIVLMAVGDTAPHGGFLLLAGVLRKEVQMTTYWRGLPKVVHSTLSIPNQNKPDGYDYYAFSYNRYYSLDIGKRIARPVTALTGKTVTKDWYNCP
ncbi:PRG4 protein, partial [Agelaius phoeniceus]|nr:PRG4 protein [Agelaius phoeniceus]